MGGYWYGKLVEGVYRWSGEVWPGLTEVKHSLELALALQVIL
jgi:hypothetical protein